MSSAPAPLNAGASSRLRAIAIIPARLDSQRLPRKMLLAESGQCLCVHTAKAVSACTSLARVVLAVDSPEVRDAARAAGIEAVMTRADHASGTDRVFEAYRSLHETADVVVNVQGDEPDISAADLARLIDAFSDPTTTAATLAAPLADASLAASQSVVKVVRDRRGDALYFSRAPIPAQGHGTTTDAAYWRHVGVYAYTPSALERFCSLERGSLERRENLEQLRWLEAGEKMHVVEANNAPQGIDTREDYERFVARVRAKRDPLDLEKARTR